MKKHVQHSYTVSHFHHREEKRLRTHSTAVPPTKRGLIVRPLTCLHKANEHTAETPERNDRQVLSSSRAPTSNTFRKTISEVALEATSIESETGGIKRSETASEAIARRPAAHLRDMPASPTFWMASVLRQAGGRHTRDVSTMASAHTELRPKTSRRRRLRRRDKREERLLQRR